MRTVTAGERTILDSDERSVVPRIEIQNVDGTWKDYSNFAYGDAQLDFLLGLDWGTSIDDPTWTGQVRLAASAKAPDGTDVSLSPYVESSPANVDDAAAPAPAIDGMRRVRWFTKTALLDGVAVTEHKVFDGYVVEVDHDNDEIVLSVSDLGHLLVTTQIEAERVYPAGLLLEEAIQQILDDNMGAGVITLAVDPSITAEPIVLSSKFKVDRIKVMDAIRNLAQNTVGAVVRYVWNGEDMELRLFMPPRGSTTSLFTYSKDRVFPEANFRVKTDDIRNVGTIRYQDSEKKAVVAVSYEVPLSVALYGRRYFEFTEASASQINTEAEARRYLTAAIDDLAQPKAEGAYNAPYNWAADVYDLYTFTANGVHFTSDQLHAVARVAHSISGDATTRLETRGNVAGYSRRWIAVEGPGATPPETDILAVTGGDPIGEDQMYGGEIFNTSEGPSVDGCGWLKMNWGSTVRRVHCWSRETKPGNPALWPVKGSVMYHAWTIERPEGKTPREGNLVRASDGRTIWAMQVPNPTRPNRTRTMIVQSEDYDGNYGPEEKHSFVAAAVPGRLYPADFVSFSVVRIDATTVRVTWTPVSDQGQTLIFRDGVNIHQVDENDFTTKTWDDEELLAEKAYLYQINKVLAGASGPREQVLIPAWVSSVEFAAPTLGSLFGLPRAVLTAPTASPGTTDKIRIEKSVDAGQYDPWTVVTEIALADFPYYDAIVIAGQFYRYLALAADGSVLDASLPVYWTNPLG